MQVSQNKGRRPYPPEFRREAVELYRRSGRILREAVRPRRSGAAELSA